MQDKSRMRKVLISDLYVKVKAEQATAAPLGGISAEVIQYFLFQHQAHRSLGSKGYFFAIRRGAP